MTMTAMMDRATEDALFAHFTAFFRRAEEERRWNLWNDVPWEAVNPSLSDALTEAVEAAYAEELFLPDWSAQLIRLLRASRGRAWFLTRWTYEEGKHLLALNEWLLQSGKRTEDELKDISVRLLTEAQWSLPLRDPVAAMAQALAREYAEIERYQALLPRAAAEGDDALVSVLQRFVADEEEHRVFFRDALRILQGREPERVEAALQGVAATPTAARFAPALRQSLGQDSS